MKAFKFLIKYVDLGLPSGTLWAESNLPNKHNVMEVLDELHDFVPTVTEFQELLECCKWEWNKKKTGYNVIGPNGNSIFLPAEGKDCLTAANAWFCDNGPDQYHSEFRVGYYWTSSHFKDERKCVNLHWFEFNQNYQTHDCAYRCIDRFNRRRIEDECMSIRTVKRIPIYEFR